MRLLAAPLALLLLGGVAGAESLEPPADLLRAAEEAYRQGLAGQADAARARTHFAQSARLYERLWRDQGIDSPGLHRNRAQAFLLAGDLPNALRAYYEGLRQWPGDRALREGQEYARGQVRYPTDSDLRALAAPREPWRLTDWLPGNVLRWLIVACYAFGWFALIRGWVTRLPSWWVTAAAAWLSAAAGGAALWIEDAQRAEALPWAVVAADGATLRQGNAASYPPRLGDRLPAGVEVRVRHRRGGWAKVELAGGVVGWLPEESLIEEWPPAPPPP